MFQWIRKQLKLLEQWSKNTNLAFNCKKTKSMSFSTRKISQHHQLYNNDILKIKLQQSNHRNSTTIQITWSCYWRTF